MADSEDPPDAPDLGPESHRYGDVVYPIRRTTRPSLDVLQHDQRALIYTGDPGRVPPLEPITDGFERRRELLNWYQAAVVRTFGHITDYLPPSHLIQDVTLVRALTEPRPHRDGWKEWLHTQVIEQMVLPACGIAYKHLRDKSAERTASVKYESPEEDWENIDPRTEHHIGMRPAYTRLDAEQAEVLDELWGGFHSRDEFSEWLHSLHPATYGTFGAEDAKRLMPDKYGVEMFLDQENIAAAVHRQWFAAIELFPQFADAARRLRASEQSESESDDTWRHA